MDIFKNQSSAVQNYFNSIVENDGYGLSLYGFFQRVIESIKKNGEELTCKFYDLDLHYIKQIEIKD